MLHSPPKFTQQQQKRSHYDVLGIHRAASHDDIKKAYLQKAREYHPDLNQHDDPTTAQQKFIEISAAYEVLKDSTKRSMYDFESREQETSTTYTSYSYHTHHHHHQRTRASPSPGYSYSGNVNRKNTMFTDEDIELEDGDNEYDELFTAEEKLEEALNSMFQGAFRRWGMGVPPRNSAKHNNSHEKKHKTTRFDSGSSHFGSPEFTFYMSRGPEERKRVRKGFAGWYEIKFSKNGSSKSGSGKQSTSSNSHNNNNNKQPHNQKKKGEDSEDSIDNKQRKKKRAEEYAKEERAQVHKNATTSNKVESYSKQSRKGRQRARMAKKMEKEANKQTQNGNNNSTVHPKRGTRKDT